MDRWSYLFARRSRTIAFTALLALLLFPALSAAAPCVVTPVGGVVILPPNGCGYLSPTDVHLILNGLPAGTTVQLGAEHRDFFNISSSPDPVGGDQESFGSNLTLHLQGTGSLATWTRTLSLTAQCLSHTDAHDPSAAVQSFDTDMRMIQGQLPAGDPDFDLLRITAGSNLGMPSPGHTTLTQLSGGNYNVDSFFDITYRIDFVGHPGGHLGGMSGSTTGTIRMSTGQPMPAQVGCVVPSSAAPGTVYLPPAGCGYVSPHDLHMMINGLPPGTSIVLAASHEKFTNITRTPGGPLGGETEDFSSNLVLRMTGTGSLSSYSRTVMVPTQCESNTAPHSPGAVVQSFDTDMFRIQGQLPPGDPDFDLLRVTAGSGFGLPSPGHTTLTLKSDGNWNVDSFFDITYRIDFIGHPGGPLGGMSGSTTGTIRMGTGVTAPPPPGPCTVVPNADGSVSLPPAGCGYVSPADFHVMLDGLPPGTEVHIAAQHAQFFNVTHIPDGTVGGETEHFQSALALHLTGTGDLAGLDRFLTMPTQCQSHVGPHTAGTNIQSFDTEMQGIQGQVTGDPDFDLLRITAGSAFGMPSPGHTTLTRQGPPGSPYNVESFFDITYRIDFIGSSTGPLAGHSGSTTGTIRMQAGQPTLLSVPGSGRPSATSVQLFNSPNPFSPGTTIQYRLLSPADVRVRVYDAAGKAVRELTDARLPAGPHAVLWDGRDKDGHKLGSGTYFIKLSVDGAVIASKKAVLIK